MSFVWVMLLSDLKREVNNGLCHNVFFLDTLHGELHEKIWSLDGQRAKKKLKATHLARTRCCTEVKCFNKDCVCMCLFKISIQYHTLRFEPSPTFHGNRSGDTSSFASKSKDYNDKIIPSKEKPLHSGNNKVFLFFLWKSNSNMLFFIN